MARARPVARLAAAASSKVGLLSAGLYVLAIAGLLALPLAGKAIYHDENALLVGHAESVIRCVKSELAKSAALPMIRRYALLLLMPDRLA